MPPLTTLVPNELILPPQANFLLIFGSTKHNSELQNYNGKYRTTNGLISKDDVFQLLILKTYTQEINYSPDTISCQTFNSKGPSSWE